MKGGGEGRGGEDPLDLLPPPEKFPSYATGLETDTGSVSEVYVV